MAKPAVVVAKPVFPIVGVGASAGGLEAFTRLLKHLPVDSGMGFVLVQHLDPQHESALTQLLKRATMMPVREAANNLRVAANHVYVIPPNKNLGIADGVLKLKPRPASRGAHHSIDTFFESLAQDRRERAIGVILSGTATDGTLGLEAIKAEGGITFAQDDSAKYDSMPRSAVAADCVDFVLKPEDIAAELARIAKHPSVAKGSSPSAPAFHSEAEREADQREGPDAALASGGHGRPRTGARQARAEARAGEDQAPLFGQDGFKKILVLLRNHCGVDFSLYKSTTIQRRITRRMVLGRHDTAEEYARFLRGNARELDALYSDCLISVTSFFRNPETFEFLQRKVFPKLLQQPGGNPLRVWVLGCSTGQEAYSIAMIFQESIEKASRTRKLQVFATDLNEALLDKARHGLYAKNLALDVSPERLRRFFVEEEGGYRVVKSLREMVVFARQNLINDPPFSRLDLISCRNLLIYLEPSLQKKVLPMFHYALKPEGYLLLGASESIGTHTELFQAVDKKNKIYARKAGAAQALHLPVKKEAGEATSAVLGSAARRAGAGQLRLTSGQPEGLQGELNAQREADRLMVNQFAPPGVLVNADLQILQFRGPTGGWLEPPTGKASFDVLKMAREGLMLPLRAVINKAKKENKAARRENVRVRQDGKTRTVNLEVIPLKNLRERCFLILFEDATVGRNVSTETPKPSRLPRPSAKEPRRNSELERELAETRDYMQSVQEQHEAANEELQASNEEVQSANEELQSINEELETAKEELESSNEELTTVNEEMANRNIELHRLNSDLVNFQTSTTLGVVLLGRDLTIRRFSAPAEKQFNLTANDVGRPIGSIRHNFKFPEPASPATEPDGDLEGLVTEVISSVREREREARDKEGRWYSLRVRPYFTLDHKVDGAVLVVVNITDLKSKESEIEAARDYAEATFQTARDPLIILRADLTVEKANDAFYKTFKVSPQETENVLIYRLDHNHWDIPKLRELLEGIIPRNSFFNDFEVTHDFDHIGRRTMLLNARRLDNPSGAPEKILLGIEDVSERQEGQTALRESEERYRTLFELGPVAVYSVDAAGAIQNFNQRAAELWGREPAIGDTDQRFCGSFKMYRPDGSFMAHDECPMAEVVSGRVQEVRDAEVHIERPDGSWVTVIVNIRPLRNDRGEVIGAINCFSDITERKRVEALQRRDLDDARRLQEISSQLVHQDDIQMLYEQILDAVKGVLNSDFASFQILHPERGPAGQLRLIAFRGYTPEAAAAWEWIGADELTTCGMALRSGRRAIVRDIETCHWLAGTETLVLYRKVGIRALQSTPLLSRSGKALGMISTAWTRIHEPSERDLRLLDVLARQAADLIERAKAQSALVASEERFRMMADNISQLAWTCDQLGNVTWYNKRWLDYTGLTFEEMADWGWKKVHHPEHVDRVVASVTRSRETGEVWEDTFPLRGRDGSYRWFLSRAVPIKDPDGNIVRWFGTNTDITEQRNSEEALRRAHQLLTDEAAHLDALVQERTVRLQETIGELEHFSYTLTHDMRAPLRAMQGFGSLLLSEHGDRLPPEGAEDLRRIIAAAGHMDALIWDSLQYAKIIRERIPLQPIDPAPVLRGIMESYPSLQPPRVDIQIDGPVPTIMANAAGLSQCFANVLTNAIKFTKPDQAPQVRIWAETRGDLVRFWFDDNGIGIPLEYQDRIFGMFQQLDKSYEGTGIGLALVRKTAERMEGKVGVESEPGKGSRFWLEFKKAAASPATQ